MLVKVISGGQTGADIGGVKAAKLAGLKTGGTMPKGFKTLEGPRPEYAALFGMTEHASPNYPPRTHQNAKDSDGTVRFAANFSTSGEICTLTGVRKSGKELFDVAILGTVQPKELAAWLVEKKITVLNVAGNSERSAPGIEEFVMAFLGETFEILRKKRK